MSSMSDNEAIRKSIQMAEDLIKSLSTKDELLAVFAQEQRRWPTRKNTWRDNESKPVPRQRNQGDVNNCWAIALFRQWYSTSILKGLSPSGLTVEQLTLGISSLYKGQKHGLRNWDPVISYMKRKGFVKEMRIHYRPNGKAEQETYEKFLCSLGGPLAVKYSCFPSYADEDPGFRILSPTAIELARSEFEFNYTNHVATMMGKGVDDEGNEYWELFESLGRNWGDSGFVRLARHQGLIHFAIEIEL